MREDVQGTNFIGLAADIVSAYVSNNSVPSSELPRLIETIHGSLVGITGAEIASEQDETLEPAVPIKKSVSPDYIVCLLDGKRFKSLKRHLNTEYGLTPEQYRAKFKLAPDYPMVAPNYARSRSELAKKMGLGRISKARRTVGRA